MKILYVGNIVPGSMSIDIVNNSLAGNKFQMNMINSLRKSNHVDIASFVAVPLDENQKKQLDLASNDNDKYYYKGKNIISSIISFRKYILKKYKNYDLVIFYNVAYPWLKIAKKMKQVKTTLILADFSEAVSYSNILLKIYANLCKKDIMTYDNVVGLSYSTKRFLKRDQKFLCIPGGIDLSIYNNVNPTVHDGKYRIMYSGNLSKVTGIDMLIEAFNDDGFNDSELIITGRGELEKEVKNAECENIKYYGSLEYKKYLKLLNDANILVNPRNMNLYENQNNFPSKVFEYLAVGKVVLSTKFIGFEEFADNFVFCESNIDSIRNELRKCLDEYDDVYLSFFRKNRLKASDYDWDKQCEKIINM